MKEEEKGETFSSPGNDEYVPHLWREVCLYKYHLATLDAIQKRAIKPIRSSRI